MTSSLIINLWITEITVVYMVFIAFKDILLLFPNGIEKSVKLMYVYEISWTYW